MVAAGCGVESRFTRTQGIQPADARESSRIPSVCLGPFGEEQAPPLESLEDQLEREGELLVVVAPAETTVVGYRAREQGDDALSARRSTETTVVVLEPRD